jgi:pyruvate,water dikinase
LILDAWRHLGGGPVAVRSSATAEDLPDASFAGQQETVLGVGDAEALLQAVRRCWSSLWTSRAIAYRVRQGFSHEEVSLAVVVQRMIEPEAAGVLFTIDPVGNADDMVVNAAYRLGEAVVSGWVTPDQWRLARRDGRVVAHTLGSKERRVVSQPGGVRTEAVPAELRARPCLSTTALTELFTLARQIEADEGLPQDIEFAWADGRIHLLQSRPVTTRPPRLGALSAGERRMLDDLLEHYPSAPLPLDEEPLQRGYDQLLEMARDVGIAYPPAAEILRMDDDGVFRAFPVRPRLGAALLRLPRALWRAARSTPANWTMSLPDAGIDTAAWLVTDVRDLDDAALLAGQRVDPFAWLGGLRYRTIDVEHGLQELADHVLGSPDLRTRYAGAGPLPTADSLADTDEGRTYLLAIERFLSTAMPYLPFSTRSWAEDPTGLHLAVQAIVRAGHPGAAAERTRAGAQRFQALVDRVKERLPRMFHGRFDRALAAYRSAHVGREASLYAIEEAYGGARQALWELGRRLADAGILGAPGHVVFARLSELDAVCIGELPAAELRHRVGRRRARREVAVQAWRSQRPPATSPAGDGLVGMAGSPGVASGPVRVIRGLDDFASLQADEILVCPYTDPTWTPLFALAAAVVSDTGGALSHAAIVAREYGIPAVLGTEVGTSILRDGEMIHVDGSTGLVRREHRTEPLPGGTRNVTQPSDR